MVSTLDSESSDPSSNLGGTFWRQCSKIGRSLPSPFAELCQDLQPRTFVRLATARSWLFLVFTQFFSVGGLRWWVLEAGIGVVLWNSADFHLFGCKEAR